MEKWSNKDIIFSHDKLGGWSEQGMGFDFSSITSAVSSSVDKLASSTLSSVTRSAEGTINKLLGVTPGQAPADLSIVPNQQIVYAPAPAPLTTVQAQTVAAPMPRWVIPTAAGVGGLILLLIIWKIMSPKAPMYYAPPMPPAYQPAR